MEAKDFVGKWVRVKENEESCPEGKFFCCGICKDDGRLHLRDPDDPYPWHISTKYVEIIE